MSTGYGQLNSFVILAGQELFGFAGPDLKLV